MNKKNIKNGNVWKIKREGNPYSRPKSQNEKLSELWRNRFFGNGPIPPNYKTLKNIKTPTTVEEFRNNLKLYFRGSSNGLYCNYSDCWNDLTVGKTTFIPYNELSKLDDLYRIFKVPTVGVIPLINYDQKDCVDYLIRNNQQNYCSGYFNDEYKVYTDLKFIQNPQWFEISNSILREFYIKVLGPFCGYYFDFDEVVNG